MAAHDRPTAKQLALLRRLAVRRGQSFAYPVTRAQASAQIARLATAEPSPRGEAARERKAISSDLSDDAGAGVLRGDEISGYGAGCRWSR